MDANTSNLVTNIITGFFGCFTTVYTSAKHRRINCCGITTDVEMKESDETQK